MIRRLLSTTALLALTAGIASAQGPFTFHYTGTSSTVGGQTDYNTTKGYFTGTAPVGFNSGSSNSFNVWCVDELNTIASGSNHTASVTNLSSLDMSATRYGNRSNYLKAAWLTGQFGEASAGPAGEQSPQWAIWAIMHGKANVCQALGGGVHPSGCNSTTVANLVTSAGTNYTNVDSRMWFVITSTNPVGQELIAQCQDTAACDDFDIPNENPTPEPATMTLLAMGLAGMAGTSLRRRRKS